MRRRRRLRRTKPGGSGKFLALLLLPLLHSYRKLNFGLPELRSLAGEKFSTSSLRIDKIIEGKITI